MLWEGRAAAVSGESSCGAEGAGLGDPLSAGVAMVGGRGKGLNISVSLFARAGNLSKGEGEQQRSRQRY